MAREDVHDAGGRRLIEGICIGLRALIQHLSTIAREGGAYARTLQEISVPVVYRRYDRAKQEFFGMAATVDKAKAATASVVKELRAAFDHPTPPPMPTHQPMDPTPSPMSGV